MRAETDLTPQQIESEATKFGLSPEEQVTVHDFGLKRTITAYPGNPNLEQFLRHLVKHGKAFPDLTQPGRWEMTPDR